MIFIIFNSNNSILNLKIIILLIYIVLFHLPKIFFTINKNLKFKVV